MKKLARSIEAKQGRRNIQCYIEWSNFFATTFLSIISQRKGTNVFWPTAKLVLEAIYPLTKIEKLHQKSFEIHAQQWETWGNCSVI